MYFVILKLYENYHKHTECYELNFLEVVTTGSPQTLSSWLVLHRNRTYGGFVDAVCDKAFVVPCWISLLNGVQDSNYIRSFQYFVLIFLIIAEVASGCIRFRAYF